MTVSTNFSVFVHALVRCLTLLAVLVENCQLCIVSVIPQFFFRAVTGVTRYVTYMVATPYAVSLSNRFNRERYCH